MTSAPASAISALSALSAGPGPAVPPVPLVPLPDRASGGASGGASDRPGLLPGRLHEGCGPARHLLALLLAGAMDGPVIWVSPAWAAGRLNTDGVCALADPARLVFVDAPRAPDLLWVLEEALRSGAAPLVVGDLPEPPGLTPVRRLHLAAAAAGAADGATPPLGLILTPGAGGAPGVESRWHMAPAHDRTGAAWRLARHRARGAAPREWRLTGAPGAWHLT